MLGSSRYLRNGRTTSFEFSRIIEEGGGVILIPYPGGEQSAVGFRLLRAAPGEAEFGNPAHDFPARITYTLGTGEDAEDGDTPVLAVRVEGRDGDGFGYALREVACAGAGAPSDVADHRSFRGDGTPLTLSDAFEEMAGADVVFLGENHDDDVAHRLQAQILEEMHRRRPEGRGVILSLEMFESDVQEVVDEYTRGLITEDHFLRSSRPWPRYTEHYRPMVEYAREHGLPVLAANPPRRHVNLVAREGPEALGALSPVALERLPPLPLFPPTERYRAQWDALMGGAGRHGTPGQPAAHPGGSSPGLEGEPPDTVPPISNGLWAQTLWDAGMAHAVASALEEDPGALVVHLAGSFHVSHGSGIPEHLDRYRPGTRAYIVVFRPVPDGDTFDPELHGGLGDLVVLTRTGATADGDR